MTESQIFDPESFGLISMNERAQQFGGKLEIAGTCSQGSMVVLKIPPAIATLAGN